MSSPGYAAPLRLDLRRSRRLALYLGAAHAGALAFIPFLPLGNVTGALLAILVVLCLARSCSARVLMRGDGDVVALVWARDGEWRLIERGGRTRVCRLRPDSYVHPELTVLNFAGGRRCSIVLLPDSLDSDTYRRLRVRLGLHSAEPAGSAYPA
ncbi:MAG: hypothetical protein IPK65_11965 [Gammaproteobacteria bacterium]|nr:hypothetical protein [Gammaproteobacteria bacterium]